MRIALTVLIAVFLPLSAFMVVLSAPTVKTLVSEAIECTTSSPEEREHLVAVAMAVRDFSLGNDDAALPKGEDHRTSITPDALAHLLDVRTVFVASEILFLVIFLVLLFLIVLSIRTAGEKSLMHPLIVGGAIPLAAALVLGLAVAIDFSAFFAWIHSIFFAEGSWTFPYDSLLIRALPYDFWLASAAMWAASMVFFCGASIGIGAIVKQRSRYSGGSSFSR